MIFHDVFLMFYIWPKSIPGFLLSERTCGVSPDIFIILWENDIVGKWDLKNMITVNPRDDDDDDMKMTYHNDHH